MVLVYGNIIIAIGDLSVDVLQAIGTIVTAISTAVSDIIVALGEAISDVVIAIGEVPGMIIDLLGSLLQRLFVPDNDYFSTKIDGLKTNLNNKIPYQQYTSNLQNIGEASGSNQQALNTSIDLNNYKLSDRMTISMSNFIDFSIFSRYRDTWFLWVRVVVYVLLLLYNINEITKFLRGFSVASYSSSHVNQNNISGGNG